jgi:hypothetical protein
MQVDVGNGACGVEEGLEPVGEGGEGVAVALVFGHEFGEDRDNVMGGGTVCPELDGEARGSEIEREVLDVELAVVGDLDGERVQAVETRGQGGDLL